jgi:hypothetical protein
MLVGYDLEDLSGCWSAQQPAMDSATAFILCDSLNVLLHLFPSLVYNRRFRYLVLGSCTGHRGTLFHGELKEVIQNILLMLLGWHSEELMGSGGARR